MEVKVPDIGDFSDVPVISILVAVGDEVAAEDPLIELESDKATMEVPCPAAGKVTAIVARDMFTGEERAIRATKIINASGPWTERVLDLGGKVDMGELLRPTKGVGMACFTRHLYLIVSMRGRANDKH